MGGGKQCGFSDYALTTAKKQTKREKLFSEMDVVVPWQVLIDLIEVPTMPPGHDRSRVRRRRKNKDGKRDPEMHQTKKGSQWYYEMKVHGCQRARPHPRC